MLTPEERVEKNPQEPEDVEENKIEEKVEEAKNRLNNAREYGWTGGFEQKFFEDFFRQALHEIDKQARQEERDRIAQRAEEIIQEERFSGTPYAMNKLIEELSA